MKINAHSRRLTLLAIACYGLLTLSACNKVSNQSEKSEKSENDTARTNSSNAASDATISTPGSGLSASKNTTAIESIPAIVQRAGDAQAGGKSLVTEPIVSCGIPLSVFQQVDIGTVYTLPERDGPAASLPYNVNVIEDDNGVQLAASNCLTCHAAPLFGELVVGLGNEFLDFTVNPSIAVERAGALVSGEHEIEAWEKFADRVAAIAPYVQTDTVGVNPANNLTFALMAHRDPETMQWLDKPTLAMPPTHVPPVSVPPWWRMKKKHAMFSMGEGRGDHASFMMTAAILCTDSLAQIEQLDSIAADVRAYIASLEPPAYPFPINADLALRGKEQFELTCSMCHGTYGEQASYPNKLIGIDIVGTDPALVDFAFGDGDVFVDWFNQSPFGERATAQPGKGYVAPPLDGVWATAPYLHNGSVPTIRAVLNSATRPDLWQHRDQSSDAESSYNQSDLGWHYRELQSTTNETSNRWVYDTNKSGYSNQGHRFGDGLNQEQLDAVIEYLKTL